MTENLIDPETFFEFEENNKLFELKHKNFYLWDILRSDIYYKILWGNDDKIHLHKRKSFNWSYFFNIFYFVRSLLFKKYDYLFFTASRTKDDEGLFFDKNIQDFLSHFPEAQCFESHQSNLSVLKNKKITVVNPISLLSLVTKFFYKSHDFIKLVNILNSNFSTLHVTRNEINNLIIQFRIEYSFYFILFKIKKPKIIFINQNGVQKGLFRAASKLNIPVIEIQHGIIDKGHLSYNFSKKINYGGGRVYLPKYYFTYSEFWKNEIFYPVNEILALGNSYYFNTFYKNKTSIVQKGILVASSDVFGEQLKELVIDLSRKNKIPIYFKLHPNQFYQKDYYIDSFEEFPNIQVFTDEKNLFDLINISNAVLVIQSTAVYEALHLKRIGIIFKKQTYMRHQHLFKDKNVYVINDADELNDVVNNGFDEDDDKKISYFNNFDPLTFSKFIEKLNVLSK